MKRIAFLAVLACLAAGAAPQTKKEKREAASERIVEGRVTDKDDKPVNGAIVKLKDQRTLQVRSFYTQTDGQYHFSGLKIDTDYQLRADYSGTTSDWKTLSVFDTRKEPVINLKMDKQVKPEPAEKKQ